MEHSPSVATVLSAWRLDPLWAALLVAGLVGYLWAFRAAAKAGLNHPRWRLGTFAAGILAVYLAVGSPIAHYGREILWVNFTSFLLLTMVAPPLILLGAPLTLAFRATHKAGRKRLRAIYRSKLASVLTFPVATWLTFAVATYLWQFTDLTEVAARDQSVRYIQQISLLVVGLLFWMPAVSADPMRWRLPYPLRSLYVFVEMTHKGLFGGMFLAMTSVMHSDFASRAPSWAPDPLLDQRMAILILWIGGNLIFLVALVAMVFGWVAYEKRNQQRTDWRLRLQNEAKAKRRAALDQVFQRPI
ncbi:MAG: cytochrome c oxidase assembly protein [bacterium]